MNRTNFQKWKIDQRYDLAVTVKSLAQKNVRARIALTNLEHYINGVIIGALCEQADKVADDDAQAHLP